MTPKQIELARHALGLPNDRFMSYRNRFFAGPGHQDYPEWISMVNAGYAAQDDKMFYLTLAGAEKAITGIEMLDREDFPDAATFVIAETGRSVLANM